MVLTKGNLILNLKILFFKTNYETDLFFKCKLPLYRFFTILFGTDPDDFIYRGYKDLTIARRAGFTNLTDRIDDLAVFGVFNDHDDHLFGEQFNPVITDPPLQRDATLGAAALDVKNRHTGEPYFF